MLVIVDTSVGGYIGFGAVVVCSLNNFFWGSVGKLASLLFGYNKSCCYTIVEKLSTMAAVVDLAVPYYVYLHIRLREEYRPMLSYLCHYGDTNDMFLIGGLVAGGETPHAVAARYLKELGGFILNSNTRFHLVKVIEDVMNYDLVKISLFLVD